MGQNTAQAGAHYRKRAAEAQQQADRFRALPGDNTASVASYERERDAWVALANEIDAYLRGELVEVVAPTSEDAAMF